SSLHKAYTDLNSRRSTKAAANWANSLSPREREQAERASRQPRLSSGAARIKDQNTLYLEPGAYTAAIPIRVARGSNMLPRWEAESRQPEKASASVWYPAPTYSAADFASKPDARMRSVKLRPTAWSSLSRAAIARAWSCAMLISTGSGSPGGRPLLRR